MDSERKHVHYQKNSIILSIFSHSVKCDSKVSYFIGETKTQFRLGPITTSIAFSFENQGVERKYLWSPEDCMWF